MPKIRSLSVRLKFLAVTTTLIIILLAGVIVYLLDPQGVQAAWYDNGWSFRKRIAINQSQVVGVHQNFALLVQITDASLAEQAQSSGDDIMFTAEDGTTKLDHEIESFNSATGALTAWVRLPTLSSSTSNSLYLYYGNPAIGNQSNPEGVWDPNYRAVWHLAEGSGTSANDSTSYNKTLTLNTAGWQASAKIDTGWDGNGSRWLTRADDDDLDFAAADNFTISMWVRSDSATNPSSTQFVLNKSLAGGTQQAGYAIYFNTSGQICFGIDDDTTWNPDDQACSSADVYDATWRHITAVKTGTSRIDLYIDGQSVGSDTSIAATGSLANARSLVIGDRQAVDGTDEFIGDIDEVRIARTNRSADWIATKFNNQDNPGNFLLLSSTEERMATVLNWKFDEGFGQTVNDSTDSRLDGELGAGNAAPERRSEDLCLFGKCLLFDGVNDHVFRTFNSSTDSGLQPGTLGFAVSFWFRRGEAISQNEVLVSRYNNGGYDVYINTSGQVCFRVAQNGNLLTSGDQICTAKSFNNNQWHFVKAIRDPAATNKQAIYITSSLEASTETITNSGSVSGSSPTLYVGIGSNGTSNPFRGYIDDVKIYREQFEDAKMRADTASANYTQGASAVFGTKDIRESLSNGLVAYYRFEESAGGTCTGGADACDLSGSDFHGDWNGTPNNAVGKFGRAIDFDSEDDYVSINDADELDLTSRFTFSTWLRPRSDAASPLDITTDGTTTTTATNQTAVTFSHTVNDQPNRVLVVTSGNEHSSTRTISSVTFNGVNLAFATGVTNSSRRAEIWYLLNPPVGSYDVVVTYNASTASILLGATNLFNVRQQAPTQVATTTSDSANTTVSFTPSNNLSAVIESVVNGTSAGNTLTPSSGQTELYEISVPSAIASANFSIQPTNTATSRTAQATIIDNQAHVAAIFAPATDSSNNVVVVGKGRDAFQIELSSGYALEVFLNNTAVLTGNIDNTRWHHVLVTFDSVNATLYLNGELIQSTALNQQTGSNTQQIIIGRYLDGLLDDLRIYNRPFSEYEVRYFYDWGPEPVSYYKIDEGQGATLNNSGFNSTTTTLTCIGANCVIPQWRPGKYGKSLLFSHSQGSYGTLNRTGLDINPQEPFSLAFWVYVEDVVNGKEEVILCDDVGNRFCLYLTGTSATSARVDLCVDGGACSSNPRSNSRVVERLWNHVVVTYDGTNHLIYIDGIDDSSDTTAPSVSDVSGNSFYLGVYRPFDTAIGCDCRIDDIRFYNYARNQKQVIADLNLNRPPIGGPVGAAVAYWNFDEGTGSTINNMGNCGSVCNATMTGFSDPPTATSGRTPEGRYDKALIFDGINDYVARSDVYQLRIPDRITLSAWVRPLNGNRTVISKWRENTGNRSYRLHLTSTGQVEFNLSSNGNDQTDLVSTSQLAINGSQWYHLVATYDGANMKIFINGTLDAQTARTGAIRENSIQVMLGSFFLSNGTRTAFYQGVMDEVRIYNFALNESEVGQEFFQGATAQLGATSTESDGQTPSDSGDRSYCVPGDTATCRAPLTYLRLNEKSGTTLLDDSGYSNSATFQGTTPTRIYSKFNNGVLFNHTGTTWIRIEDRPPFNFSTTPFTMMGWFKLSSWRYSDNRLYSKGTLWGIRRNGTTNGLQFFTSGLTNVNLNTTNTNLTDGQWYHLAVVWTGTEKIFYIDGQIDNRVAATGNLSTNTNTYVTIGNEASTGSGTFRAETDELKIYDYARSVRQINWDLNRGKPYAWWKFDDCQDTTAYDGANNSNHATIQIGSSGSYTSAGNCNSGSSSEAWTAGRNAVFNSGLGLDGTDDKVITTNGASVRNLNQVTVSAWIRPSSYNANGAKIFFEPTASSSSNARIELVLNGNGTVSFQGRAPDGDGLTTWVTTTRTIPLNQWSHVVGVFDSVSGQHAVYLNKFQTTATVAEAAFTDSDPIAPPYIGAISSGASTFNLTGLVDDVRLYPYALTQLQVNVLFAGDGAAVFGPSSGLP